MIGDVIFYWFFSSAIILLLNVIAREIGFYDN